MLTHADLAAYVVDLDDTELLAFAVRVSAWRKLLLESGYDEHRRLVTRSLAAVSNGFADRGWSSSRLSPPSARSPQWKTVHARAGHLVAERNGTTPNEVRREIARWAATVKLRAA